VTTVTVPAVGGLVGWAAATDHKRLAARVGALVGIFFAAGGIVALIMRSELARPGLQVVSRQNYNELFSLHGSTMLYLVMVPAALGLGMYLVPLQIGAADLLAPRLNLFAVWLVFGGGLLSYMGHVLRTPGPEFARLLAARRPDIEVAVVAPGTRVPVPAPEQMDV